MSDELLPDESTPEELRLPDELAAFEALLAAKPLAAVGIDRDELMYRAGWAACQSQALQPRTLPGGRFEAVQTLTDTQGYPPAEPGAAKTWRTVGWSLASAALAASMAVMGMWGWDAAGRRQQENVGGETPRLAMVEEVVGAPAAELVSGDDRPARNEFPLNQLNRLLESNGRGGGSLTLAGPWLAMQERQATTGPRNRVEEVAASSETAVPAPKSARELWEEFLPHHSTPPASRWPWQLRSEGESI